jgi:hypothetical protein
MQHILNTIPYPEKELGLMKKNVLYLKFKILQGINMTYMNTISVLILFMGNLQYKSPYKTNLPKKSQADQKRMIHSRQIKL